MSNQNKHKEKMQRYKEKVDNKIAQAQEERGIFIVITGKGKGKTTSAMGNVIRALGHGYKAGIAQFIKGQWDSGEVNFIREHVDIEYHAMKTGFTWNTQDKEADTQACLDTWDAAKGMLANPDLKLVVFDEITYMFSYGYLDIELFIEALNNRPKDQTVIVTGRNAKQALVDLADTVSDVGEVKHAFHAGVKAQEGIDW